MSRVGRFTVGVVVVLGLVGCGAKAATAPEVPNIPDGAGEDGSIPDGERISPFDDGNAAIRNLDPVLLEAVRDAATEARLDRVEIGVTSGWRSKDYQRRLLDEAVAKYGSLEEARRFVNTPEKSTHVTGNAVDIGPTDAADWMIQHGADYGLCQAYANEMWHFELLTTPGGQCPQARADAAG